MSIKSVKRAIVCGILEEKFNERGETDEKCAIVRCLLLRGLREFIQFDVAFQFEKDDLLGRIENKQRVAFRANLIALFYCFFA